MIAGDDNDACRRRHRVPRPLQTRPQCRGLAGSNGGGAVAPAGLAEAGTAMAGTVSVRTMKVSSSRPHPMMNPAWIMIAMEPTIRPNMLAAKMMPAEVMIRAGAGHGAEDPDADVAGGFLLSQETRACCSRRPRRPG